MAKIFTCLLLAVALTLAVCSAEPPRFRNVARRRSGGVRANLRSLARQEVAPPTDAAAAATTEAAAVDAAAAPYPAAGVTPAVPFDLPTETEAPLAQPDETYGPPDATYGPPTVDEQEPEPTYLPPDNTYGPPDNTYGPPAAQPEVAADAAPEATPVDAELISQQLIQPRVKAITRARASSPQRLRAAAPPARRPVTHVEIIRSEPVIVYTLQ